MMKDQAWKLRDLIPDAEIYPRIATNFHTKRLAITSGKGGVGKSVIALNFALLLAQHDYRTLLIDGDINLSKLPIMTDTAPRYDFADLKRGEKMLQEIIYEYQPGCSILPTGSGALELVNHRDEFQLHFQNQFQQLNGKYDYMLIDSATGISSVVFSELASSDEVIVVATPEPTSIADAYAVIKIMSYYYPQIPIYLLLNLVESEVEAVATSKKFSLITQKYLHRSINYLGCLFRDNSVMESIKKQQPLALENESSLFIKQLTKIMQRWLESFHQDFQSVVELRN